MLRNSSWFWFVLVVGCGESKAPDGCPPEAPVPVQECKTGYPQIEAALTESTVELKRTRVGREKGLVPACFMMAAPDYSCDYDETTNATHCDAEGHGVTPEQSFLVNWQDQDCGSYAGDVYLEASSGSAARTLVGHIIPMEPGRLRVEAVGDFSLGVPLPAPPGGSSAVIELDDGLCLVNLHAAPGSDGTSSAVALCADF